MSTIEYIDLYERAQNNTNSKYHMFVFDIANSKTMDKKTRNNATLQMEQLMIKIYEEIRKMESYTKQKILIVGIDNIVTYKNQNKVMYKFGMLFEPFLFADTFGFTIYKDSISKDIILSIYEKYKKELNINFDFHISDAHYETNKWEEGNTLFFRGYCIDILANYHKDYIKKLIKKINV